MIQLPNSSHFRLGSAMSKSYLASIAAVGAVVLGLATFALYARAVPRMALSVQKIDVGEIGLGELASAKVVVSNLGIWPLDILGVYTDCGCTRARINRRRLMRGETAELQIEVTGTKLIEHGIQRVAVVSSDAIGESVVNVEFSVKPERLTVSPTTISFGRVNQEDLPATMSVAFVAPGGINEYECRFLTGNEYFDVSDRVSGAEVSVRHDAPNGQLFGTLRVAAGDELRDVNVTAFVRGRVFAAPSFLRVRSNIQTPSMKEIVVHCRDAGVGVEVVHVSLQPEMHGLSVAKSSQRNVISVNVISQREEPSVAVGKYFGAIEVGVTLDDLTTASLCVPVEVQY